LAGTTPPPIPASGGQETLIISGLIPDATYWWAIKSSNTAGGSAVDSTTIEPSTVAGSFGVAINVNGLNGGTAYGRVVWGDFENDGDLDILSTGWDKLQIFLNNGNGIFNSTEIDVDGVSGGLGVGDAAWGDFDNDGDLDILASGTDGGGLGKLRVYRNNGNGTMDSSQIEVDGLDGGLRDSAVDWGDFDNDGDLDIAVGGSTGGGGETIELRVYRNNGNGTFDPNQIEVIGADGGLVGGDVKWGDYNNDGALDLVAMGDDTSGIGQFWIFRNNRNGSFTEIGGISLDINSPYFSK
jgi:hypothetical protein